FQMYEKPNISIPKASSQTTDETNLFDTFSDIELLQLGVPEELIPLVRGIERTEHLESYESNLPADVYEYLYYLSEGISIEEILEEIEAGKTDNSTELSANAQKNVYILTDDNDLENILSGDFDKWKLFLHPSQRALAYGEY